MNRAFIPWFVAAGFALLFAASLVSKAPSQDILSAENKLESTAVNGASEARTSEVLGEKKITVVRIIDGDTIEIDRDGDRVKVRYIGVDTPETGDCFGAQASKANSSLLLGKNVNLETDIQLLDRYGRTLAYVWADNLMVNDELVRQGFARVSTYPPNVKYQDRFVRAEREAREANRGLWNDVVCNSTSDVVQTEPGNCSIKGNISSSGEKIYHLPGQRYYDKTKIEEGAGERWFCSEDEAVKSGWRKSKV